MREHEDLRELLNAAGLSRIADAVGRLALPSVRVRTTLADEGQLPLGVSKIGGLPDLPFGQAWPRVRSLPERRLEPFPLGFVAQFNASELAPHDAERVLPGAGMLYFFFDYEHIFDADKVYPRGWRVLHYTGDLGSLQRTHPPADLPIDERYRARAVEFSTELCLPYYFPRESETIERLGEELSEDEYLAYWKLQRQLSGTDDDRNHVIHRLLGHADPIQNDMQLECQLRTHGVHEWSGPRVQALRSRAADWRLLLQIDTDDDDDELSWGDSGRIYYWIRQQDLQRRDFNYVWLVLQCT